MINERGISRHIEGNGSGLFQGIISEIAWRDKKINEENLQSVWLLVEPDASRKQARSVTA
jgi:hypothetical protein